MKPIKLLVALSALLATAAVAKTTTWTGTTDSSWSDSSNWDNGTPATSDIVILRDASFASVFNNPTGYDLGDLTIAKLCLEFQEGSEDYVIADSGTSVLSIEVPNPGDIGLQYVPGLANSNDNVDVELQVGVNVVNDQQWDISRGDNTNGGRVVPSLEVSGILSGSGEIDTDTTIGGFGGGNLDFSNTGNTFTGDFRVNTFNKVVTFASLGDGGLINLDENNSRAGYTGPGATLVRDVRWDNNNNGIRNDGSGELIIDGDVNGFNSNAFRTLADDADITITGSIGSTNDNAGFSARGSNTTTLQGSSSYRGLTGAGHTGNNGGTTLVLDSTFSATESLGFNVGNNATLDVTLLDGGAGLTLGTTASDDPQRLGGRGTVLGAVWTTTAGNAIIPSDVSDTSRVIDVDQVLDPASNWGRTLTLDSLDASAGATFRFDLGGSNESRIDFDGTLTGSTDAGDLRFEFTDNGIVADTPYTLFTYASTAISGLDVADFSAVSGVPAGTTADFTVGATEVTVTFSSSGPTFAQWAASNITALEPGADATFDGSADTDTFSNGLEWILGGDPLAFEAQTDLVTQTVDADGIGGDDGLTLSFTRNDDTQATTTLEVEYSNDLFDSDINTVVVGPSSSSEANGVEITVTEDGTNPDQIDVFIPASNAADGKLFGRLDASN